MKVRHYLVGVVILLRCVASIRYLTRVRFYLNLQVTESNKSNNGGI